MQFRLLTAADYTALFHAFNLAFSKYVVKIQLTDDQFKSKLEREGVKLELCGGAFTPKGEMAGFILTAPGNRKGKRTAYNAGTGVIPDHRGQGITTDLYEFLLSKFREMQVEQCLLEVIDINKPALHIYQQAGFTKSRLLHCFRGAKEALQLSNMSAAGVTLKQVNSPNWELYRTFRNAEPSWQNSDNAVMRSPEQKFIVEAWFDEKCVGYGIIFKESGGVAQLAVATEHRRKSIGSGLLQALMQLTENQNITFLNVDAGCKPLLTFLENRQFPLLLSQIEMVRKV